MTTTEQEKEPEFYIVDKKTIDDITSILVNYYPDIRSRPLSDELKQER